MAVQVYFIGVGPGDPELLTIKGKEIIGKADVIIYADSLINPAVCRLAKSDAEIYGSAALSLKEIMGIVESAVKQGKMVARLQSGDPSIYGAIHEQMAVLEAHGIEYEIVPGVSSLFAAAASLKTELTVPEISQTVIVTRMVGRTAVPEKERLIGMAAHQATLAIFLSVSLIENVVKELMDGGYPGDTPAAVVYKVSWDDEVVVRSTLKDIAGKVRELRIKKQALILVGNVLDSVKGKGKRSRLYNETFSHAYRRRKT
jgi:precorrin-4/cobalt-precorrin-4 C11-methyltransferase